MNERRLTAGARTGRYLERAQIGHAMADVYRQPLVFHPAYVPSFFVDRRYLHCDFSPCVELIDFIYR
jgi:hypothetical protein